MGVKPHRWDPFPIEESPSPSSRQGPGEKTASVNREVDPTSPRSAGGTVAGRNCSSCVPRSAVCCYGSPVADGHLVLLLEGTGVGLVVRLRESNE